MKKLVGTRYKSHSAVVAKIFVTHSFRSSRPEVFCKKVFLEISQNSEENNCARVSFLIKLQAEACIFIKNETLSQVFSREFCEISKNTFSLRYSANYVITNK